MFNNQITGFANEYEFVDYLDGRLVKNTNILFRDLFLNLYSEIDENEMIRCWINYKKEKTDIFLKINDCIKKISLKKGIKNSVHVEHIETFIYYLKTIGINKKIIYDVLKYHYGDDTIDGSGKNRMSIFEYKSKYQKTIDIINTKFQNDNIIIDMINRFILFDKEAKTRIDVVIYGVINDFVYINKNEIVELFLKHKNDYSSCLHFSLLSYQPLTRCLNRNSKYNDKRHYVQIKWYNIFDNILEIMNNRLMVEQFKI